MGGLAFDPSPLFTLYWVAASLVFYISQSFCWTLSFFRGSPTSCSSFVPLYTRKAVRYQTGIEGNKPAREFTGREKGMSRNKFRFSSDVVLCGVASKGFCRTSNCQCNFFPHGCWSEWWILQTNSSTWIFCLHHCTHAHSSSIDLLLSGSYFVPGLPEDQSTYRSELAGILGVFLCSFEILTTHFLITSDTIEIGLDGDSLLDEVKSDRPLQIHQLDFDLLQFKCALLVKWLLRLQCETEMGLVPDPGLFGVGHFLIVNKFCLSVLRPSRDQNYCTSCRWVFEQFLLNIAELISTYSYGTSFINQFEKNQSNICFPK